MTKISLLIVLQVGLLLELEGVVSINNLDTLEPTVIRSPAMGMDPDDAFGWSAIFHQVEVVLDSDDKNEVLRKTRVLIGAPRGSYPGGLSLNDPLVAAEMNTGLVYSCPIGQGQCEGITGNVALYNGGGVSADITNGIQRNFTTGLEQLYVAPLSEGRLFDQAPNSFVEASITYLQSEQKNGQLMGAVLYSNGENVVACAPRWVTSFLLPNHAQPRGICYSGDRDLTNFKTVLPCVLRGSSSTAVGNGYCSTGGSVAIANGRIHLGSPGFDENVGALDSRPLTSAIEVPFDRTQPFFANVNRQMTDVEAAMFGYAVVSGYVRNPRGTSAEEDVLVSAPRDRQATYIGKVYLVTSAILGTFVNSAIASGTQMAEFFGFSMALLDINGDNYDDLVVGAPMYTKLLEPLSVEQGRVYVFFNKGNGSLIQTPVIFENGLAHTRFGYVVSGVGDINADGYEDVVIGAPFEPSSVSTQNKGAIYIYYGYSSSEAFGSQKPQKIHADAITSSVSTLSQLSFFGFSISGKMDIDKNQYADIVVGSHTEQAVIILRSLPVVTVTTTFAQVPDVSIEINPSFGVTFRANYTGVGVTTSISIPYVFSERVPSGGEPRLFFSGTSREVRGTFDLTGPGVMVEKTVTVTTTDDFRVTTPYELMLVLGEVFRNTSGPVTGSQPLSDFSGSPVVIQAGTSTITVGIDNPCGDDGCATDVALSLSNTTSSLNLIQGRDMTVPVIFGYTINGPEEGRNLELEFSGLPLSVFSDLSLLSNDQEGAMFQCSLLQSGGGNATCTLQNRLFINQTRSATAVLVINNRELRGNEEDFMLTVTVRIADVRNNTELNANNSVVKVPVSVSSSSDVSPAAVTFGRPEFSYNGITPETVRSSGDLGEQVRVTLSLSNTGPSIILNTSISFSLPFMVSGEDKQYLLYPVSILPTISTVGGLAGTTVNCSSEGLDPDNLDAASSAGRSKRSSPMMLESRRARRATQRYSSRLTIRQTTTPDTIVVDCDSGNCLTFTCNIERLVADRVDIILETIIDERFFGKISKGKYAITVNSSVTVVDEFQREEEQSRGTVLLVRREVQTRDNTSLIHAVVWSVVGAVILLIAIVISLYFCGFFKRKVKPEEDEVEEFADNSVKTPPTNEEDFTKL